VKFVLGFQKEGKLEQVILAGNFEEMFLEDMLVHWFLKGRLGSLEHKLERMFLGDKFG
jgi:hypothetical protein